MTAKKAEPKRTRGGQPIAPEERTEVVSIRLKPAHREKLERLGGIVWLRERIERARET